jgi:hypothetical protein
MIEIGEKQKMDLCRPVSSFIGFDYCHHCYCHTSAFVFLVAILAGHFVNLIQVECNVSGLAFERETVHGPKLLSYF